MHRRVQGSQLYREMCNRDVEMRPWLCRNLPRIATRGCPVAQAWVSDKAATRDIAAAGIIMINACHWFETDL
jgi:hypothetical protein